VGAAGVLHLESVAGTFELRGRAAWRFTKLVSIGGVDGGGGGVYCQRRRDR
jgi:hypothetical protein